MPKLVCTDQFKIFCTRLILVQELIARPSYGILRLDDISSSSPSILLPPLMWIGKQTRALPHAAQTSMYFMGADGLEHIEIEYINVKILT